MPLGSAGQGNLHPTPSADGGQRPASTVQEWKPPVGNAGARAALCPVRSRLRQPSLPGPHLHLFVQC